MNYFFLFIVTGLAVIWDIRTRKIPNLLLIGGLAIGWCIQIIEYGREGMLQFLGGSLIPLFLLAVLFYFRMLGAGDIKLFSVIGGFLGINSIIPCIAVSFLLGAILSLFLLIGRGILKERLQYFFAYFCSYFQTKKWVSYQNGVDKKSSFCFSIPVLFSVLLFIGGFY